MSDDIIERKFLRSVGLKINNDGILFYHDYGEIFFPWDSITHIFAVLLKKDMTPNLPLYILVQKESPTFYYIDGNAISLKYLKTEDDYDFVNPTSLFQLKKNKEESLKKVFKNICFNFKTAYIDKPLVTYLSRSQVFLPTFLTFNAISEYCSKIIESIDVSEHKGAQALREGEDLKKLSSPKKERGEFSEGTVLEGRYTVQEIKKGGMGIVYIVFDSQNVKFYAMKTFKEEYLWDEKMINQFIHEAQIWIELGHHPNIVKAELVKKIEGKPYIFLEYIQGTDLEESMLNEKISVKRALDFGIQFCEGMHYAYRKLGLIHRDIKPSNCFITREGILKISDFGLGKIFEKTVPVGGGSAAGLRKGEDTSTESTMIEGTLSFMAPELFTELCSSSIKTDIYSFGIVLYMMLTGINPFYDEDPTEIIANQVTLVPEEPCKLNPDVPLFLSEAVMKCIHKEKRYRYDDFSQIKADFISFYKKITGDDYEALEVQEDFTEEDWINKGLSLLSLNCKSDAIINFDQALKINPGSVNALMYKGFTLLNSGNIDEAISYLEQGCAIEPDNWKIWYYKGEAYWKSGDREGALECYDYALSLTDETSAILGRKGILLGEMDKMEEALVSFEESLSQNPRAADIWYEKGILLMKKKQLTAAYDCFKNSVEIEPRSKWAWYYQGVLLFQLGFLIQSIEAQQKTLAIEHEFADAWICIGNCYKELGDRKRAIEAYKTAIRVKPDSVDSYLSHIKLLKDECKWEEALELTKDIMGLVKNNDDLLIEWAEILFFLSFFKKSSLIVQNILERDPGNERAKFLFTTLQGYSHEREILFEKINSTPYSEIFSLKDLNGLLSFFCSVEDAVSYLEGQGPVLGLSYLKSCLYIVEGKYEMAFAHAEKINAPAGEGGVRLKELIEEFVTDKKRVASQKKGILGTFFKKMDGAPSIVREDKTPEELLLYAIKSIRENRFSDSRKYLRQALSIKPEMHACRFFMGKAYELDGNEKKARFFYDDFIRNVPYSLGYWKERGFLEPQKIDDAFCVWIKYSPRDCRPWIEYLKYISERKYYEKLKLLASELVESSVLDGNEDLAVYWNLKGFLQLFLGRYREAQESFSRASQLDLNNVPSMIGSYKCNLAKGNFDEASLILQKLQEGPIRDYLFSELYMYKHKEQESLDFIDWAIAKRPGSLILKYYKAKLYLRFRKYEAFFELCNSITTIATGAIPIRTLRAVRLAQIDKIHDAIVELSKVLRHDKHNLIALKNSGLLYIRLGNYQKALEQFDSSLSLCSLDYEIYLGKGMAFYYLGEYMNARECLIKALQRNIADPDLWQFLGAVYFHLEDFPESGRCWDRALAVRNRSKQALTNKGIFLYEMGQYLMAQECVDRALRISDEHPAAWFLRAHCCWRMGDLKEALKSVEKGLSFQPESIKGWIFRGIMEFDSKNYAMSLQSFEKAAHLENKSAVIWYNRALVGFCIKNQPEVRKSIDRALALNPDFFEALLLRSIFERSFDSEIAAMTFLTKAQNLDPVKFENWLVKYRETKDPTSSLRPIEIEEDPFDLPMARPIYEIEPIELLHCLYPERLL